MRPLAPRRFVNGEVVVPGVGQTIAFALCIVAPVVPEVDVELEQAGLTGVQARLNGCEGGLEARGAVGNPYVVRILGVVNGARLSVVEMVPIALPRVANTVGVGGNGGGRHHVLVDIVGVPHVVFGVVNNAVAILISHQLEGSSQGNSGVKVREAVADAPVMALARGASVAFLRNVVAGVFVVTCLTGIRHAFVASRQLEDQFNFVDPAVVALVPVLILCVGGSSIAANEAVAKVMVVAVVIGCAQRRRNVEQNARHATDVRRGHRSS